MGLTSSAVLKSSFVFVIYMLGAQCSVRVSGVFVLEFRGGSRLCSLGGQSSDHYCTTAMCCSEVVLHCVSKKSSPLGIS